MIDILSLIPPDHKVTNKGWHTFNAPCCVHRGETPDRRGRGGIHMEENGWVYRCFNCGFKAMFTYGREIHISVRKLLLWLGASDNDIGHLVLDNMRYRSMEDVLFERQHTPIQHVSFKSCELPDGSRQITKSDKKFVEYLANRGIDFQSYPFLITPNDKVRNRNRVIIPYSHEGQIVGYTSRYLDDRMPKYVNHNQEGYLFGVDLQHRDWKYVIVVEGIFDAISIDGVAVLHNEIGEIQAQQLKSMGKEVIVVPDFDKSGLMLVDHALRNGFHVSIPEWDNDIKDINDAVKVHGKLYTLLMIMKYKKESTIKIKLAKRWLQNRVKANERV